jgi:hypothetical protein
MIIDGLDFTIKKIDIQNNTHTVNFGYKSVPIPGNQSIRIYTETSNQNYMALDKWFNGIFSGNLYSSPMNPSPSSYKKNVIYNTVQIYGLFPTNCEFTSTGILVTFSADYIQGDLRLFELQKLRKKKLQKLNLLQ